ncbi:hypothetical protein K432DRAFT_389838 [Lepidopterella palustris CBS 459.81]|uniref:Uncharacterized protein n=1 Tax=Lepidopterella palustris CBS 459.81 TaxID=1314670 RepID=A0A8E2EHU3_9PEZI|nr:hypothetical protein K432DRAFT_389838 [Lepidopterella palustris CBS 459.81]
MCQETHFQCICKAQSHRSIIPCALVKHLRQHGIPTLPCNYTRATTPRLGYLCPTCRVKYRGKTIVSPTWVAGYNAGYATLAPTLPQASYNTKTAASRSTQRPPNRVPEAYPQGYIIGRVNRAKQPTTSGAQVPNRSKRFQGPDASVRVPPRTSWPNPWQYLEGLGADTEDASLDAMDASLPCPPQLAPTSSLREMLESTFAKARAALNPSFEKAGEAGPSGTCGLSSADLLNRKAEGQARNESITSASASAIDSTTQAEPFDTPHEVPGSRSCIAKIADSSTPSDRVKAKDDPRSAIADLSSWPKPSASSPSSSAFKAPSKPSASPSSKDVIFSGSDVVWILSEAESAKSGKKMFSGGDVVWVLSDEEKRKQRADAAGESEGECAAWGNGGEGEEEGAG